MKQKVASGLEMAQHRKPVGTEGIGCRKVIGFHCKTSTFTVIASTIMVFMEHTSDSLLWSKTSSHKKTNCFDGSEQRLADALGMFGFCDYIFRGYCYWCFSQLPSQSIMKVSCLVGPSNILLRCALFISSSLSLYLLHPPSAYPFARLLIFLSTYLPSLFI